MQRQKMQNPMRMNSDSLYHFSIITGEIDCTLCLWSYLVFRKENELCIQYDHCQRKQMWDFANGRSADESDERKNCKNERKIECEWMIRMKEKDNEKKSTREKAWIEKESMRERTNEIKEWKREKVKKRVHKKWFSIASLSIDSWITNQNL